MTNSMNELIQIASQAAAQGDRVLFIASLVVCGSFAAIVMRYFVRQHERLLEDHQQARDAYQESLRDLVAEQSTANGKLIVCLECNTKMLEECRDELRQGRRGYKG